MMGKTLESRWNRVTDVLLRAAVTLAFVGILQPVTPASAQTAVRGIVTDRTTEKPLVGAAVELRRGGAIVERTVSGADGSFLFVVDTGQSPQAQNFKLGVSHERFVTADYDVVIASGKADSPIYRAILVRKAVADCQPRRARRVIVGYFRPPSGTPGVADFGARVSDALLYQLSFLERSRVVTERRPSVLACVQLDDRDNLPALARELKTDALMAGTVARPDGRSRYNIAMFLGDPYGLFDTTTLVSSRDVDLDDPSASRLSPEALASVLRALLTGYLKNEQYAECVELSGLALAELPKPSPQAIVDIRAECLRKQPAAQLTGRSR